MVKSHFRVGFHFLLFSTLSFFLFLPIAKAEKLNKQVVATVNGSNITGTQLRVEINRIIPLTTYHSKMSQQRKSEFTKTAMENLILNELKFQRAEKQNLTIDKKIIKDEVKKVIKRFKSKKNFKKTLKANDMSLDDLRKTIRRTFLIQKIDEAENKKEITVTDDDIKNYYLNNKKKFIMPAQRRIKVILLKVDPSSRRTKWAKTKARIEVLLERINSGEDFGEIAKKYSDDTSRQNDGELGWLHNGQLLSELNEAAFKLKKGEVSPIIESLFGFHIVKVVDIKDSKQMTLEELKIDRLKGELKRKLTREKEAAWIATLKKDAEIKILLDNF